jgi:long-chain acyl-CoA synthetase
VEIIKNTLRDIYANSISKYGPYKSYSLINGESLTYSEFDERVKKLVNILDQHGVKAGEKVALIGNGCPNWPASYLAVTTTARIIVPLLQDFTAFEIANILEHSETKNIIIAKRYIYKLSDSIRDKLELIIALEDFEILKVASDNDLTNVNSPSAVINERTVPKPDDTASIIYTSGTSGTSKGVILSHYNISSNVQMCYAIFPVGMDDIFLSFLPLSHAYECTLGMLFPFSRGSSVVYLNGAPTPSLLMPALRKIRPTIICSVPLVVEKIYKNKVRSMFTSNWLKQIIYSIRPVRRLLHMVAGKELKKIFGGRLRFFGIGGAKLDSMVEQFLKDAGFPYAIGYGLTECSPLIARAIHKPRIGSTGTVLPGMELRVVNKSSDGIGEVEVKGPNIMKGYFKDPEKTKEAFTEDGWFRTKDLAKTDKKGNLYLKGRKDNMMLGSNGENIYPEEIENVINENDFVMESLVAKKRGKLVAKVYFNYDMIVAEKDIKEIELALRKKVSEKYDQLSEMYNETYDRLYKKYNEKFSQIIAKYKEWREKSIQESSDSSSNPVRNTKQSKHHMETRIEDEKDLNEIQDQIFQRKIDKLKKDLLDYVNSHVNKTSKISYIYEQTVPFKKTATQKIKRYLYT